MKEFNDSNGDLWTVRECEDSEETSCVVIEKRMAPVPREMYTDPSDSLHIPLSSLADLIEALKQFDREAGKPPTERSEQ